MYNAAEQGSGVSAEDQRRIAKEIAANQELKRSWKPETPAVRLSLLEILPVIPHTLSLDEARKCVSDLSYSPTGVPNPILVLFSPLELGQGLTSYAFPPLSEIKKRYHAAAQLFHPDTNQQPGANEVAQYLNSAYAQLDSDQEIAQTVQRLKEWNQYLSRAKAEQATTLNNSAYVPGTGTSSFLASERHRSTTSRPQSAGEKKSSPPEQNGLTISFTVGGVRYEFPFAGESRPMSREREEALRHYFIFGDFEPYARVFGKEFSEQIDAFGARFQKSVDTFRSTPIFPGEKRHGETPTPADVLTRAVQARPSRSATPTHEPVGNQRPKNVYRVPVPQAPTVPLRERLAPLINPLMRLGQLIEKALTSAGNKPARPPVEQQPPVVQRPTRDLPPEFYEVKGKHD